MISIPFLFNQYINSDKYQQIYDYSWKSQKHSGNQNQQMKDFGKVPLNKNKWFIAYLILGSLCMITEIVLLIYFMANAGDCIEDNYCLNWNYGENYHTCVIGYQIYCCGSSGGFSCGDFSGICQCLGDDFVYCNGRWATLWILGMTSLGFLVGLVIFYVTHRNKKQEYLVRAQYQSMT